MGFDRFARNVAIALFTMAALAAAAATLGSAIDVITRFQGGFILFDYELLAALASIAMALGAPAALYIFRDPNEPPGPRWLGAPGNGIATLALAAYSGLALYTLAMAMVLFIKSGAAGPADLLRLSFQITGFAVILLLQVASLAAIRVRLPAWPQALLIGMVGPLILIASDEMEWDRIAGLLGNILVRSLQSAGDTLWALAPAAAVAGAIAALRPGARIAPMAAPLMFLVIGGNLGSAAIGSLLEGLGWALVLLGAMQAASGWLRGFPAAIDDVIGVVMPLVLLPTIFLGLTTPNEAACLFAVPALIILGLAAVQKRGQAAWPVLASGLGYGLGVILLVVGAEFLGLALALVDMTNLLVDRVAPLLVGVGGFLLPLAFALAIATLLGGPTGLLLGLMLFFPVSQKVGYAPEYSIAVGILASLAGASLHTWLAPILTATTETYGRTNFRSAAIGAVPPLLLALLIGAFPALLAVQ